jgi:methionine-rich copper-binding protein CopC
VADMVTDVRHRGWVVAASVLAATTAMSLVGAPPASAHARVVSSTPAEGSIVSSLTTARLTFNEPVTGTASALRVLNSTGATLSGPARVSGSSVTASLRALPAGRYAMVYRVTSADGHSISDALGFSVRLPDPPSSAATLRLSGETVGLSGTRVGTRTLRLRGDLREAIGQVTWRLPGIPEPFTWSLAKGRAKGMLPFAGSYSVTVTAYSSASSTRTLTGVVRISP